MHVSLSLVTARTGGATHVAVKQSWLTRNIAKWYIIFFFLNCKREHLLKLLILCFSFIKHFHLKQEISNWIWTKRIKCVFPGHNALNKVATSRCAITSDYIRRENSDSTMDTNFSVTRLRWTRYWALLPYKVWTVCLKSKLIVCQSKKKKKSKVVWRPALVLTL